jgi:hypothetical protein
MSQLLITVLASGVVAAYVSHRLATTRADKDFRLKRLEELFISLDKFSSNYNATMAPMMPVMRGAIPFARVQELIEKNKDAEAGTSLKTVEMLVRIYFPELRVMYDELIKIRDKIAKEFFTPFLTRAGRGQPCVDLLEGFSEALLEFHHVSERFKEEIFLVAEKTRPVSILRRLERAISRPAKLLGRNGR